MNTSPTQFIQYLDCSLSVKQDNTCMVPDDDVLVITGDGRYDAR